jgi:PAS domain S-box-containing protein
MAASDSARRNASKREREKIEAEQFRLLVESVEDYAIFMLDPEGRIVSWNRGAERIKGYKADEVLGKHFSIFYTQEDRRRGHPEWELRVAAEQGRYAEEGLRVRKGGSRFPAHVTITALRDDAGRLVGFAKVTRDITERRQAEEWQRVSEILENITDAFFSLDREWRFTYINREAEQQFQRPREELLGRSLWDAFPQTVGTISDTEYHRAMEERITVSFEQFFPPLGGWFEARAYPSPEGLSVYFHGINERKRAEMAQRLLAESGAALAASLDSPKTLAIVARLAVPALADLCVVDMIGEDGESHRVAAVHRDPAKEELMRRVRRFRPPPGSPLSRPLQTGEPVLIAEVSARDIDRMAGSEEHARLIQATGVRSLMAVPLIARGHTLGVITFAATESGRTYGPDDLALAQELASRAALAVDNARLYRRAEDARGEAERRREELERVMESRSRLMRGFSHDVKNPLGAADGYLQLLEMGVQGHLTEKQKESVEKVRRALHSALRLIEDLLDLARAEAGEIEVERVPMSARDAAREVAEEYRAQAAAEGLTLDVALPEEVPITESDSARVRQILGNLIANAIKYTPEGGYVRVSASVREGGKAPGPGRWVAVDVSDNGPGLTEEQQQHLFEEFTRFETAAGERGTGIGLAISHRIARALGGDVTVESEVGAGSTFTLWLPCTAGR